MVECACGKVRYSSRRAARRAARRAPGGPDGRMHAYECVPGVWHVGHGWRWRIVESTRAGMTKEIADGEA